MAIYETDIKLLESERLADTEDGGGRLTGNEVQDGQANNLFPDISQLDRVYGRVQLRKAYLAVLSPNTDAYYGSHIILDQPPNDPNVTVTMMDTGSWTDQRERARDRIESYVVSANESRMQLFGDQLEGQRTIRAISRLDAPEPEVGDVYNMSLEHDDHPDRNQFIRVTGRTLQEREFEDSRGSFIRRENILEISEPLRHDFPGAQVTRESGHSSPTLLRDTQVADAARYYSIQALETDAKAGDLQVQIPSLMTPLVPSTQAEEAVTDEQGAGNVTLAIESGGETLEVPDVAVTAEIEIGLANRQFTYVYSMEPRPARNTIRVDFRSQGRWYTLQDNGNGNMTGNGAGQVDYETGTINVTLDELPDVPSSLLFSWGEAGTQYLDASGEVWAVQPPPQEHLRGDGSIRPGSLTINYLSGGVEYTVNDDGQGNLTGDATGRVRYTGNRAGADITFDYPVESGSIIQMIADEAVETQQTVSYDSETAIIDLGDDYQMGTADFRWSATRNARWYNQTIASTNDRIDTRDEPASLRRRAFDDGDGNIRIRWGRGYDRDTIVGSVDYTTNQATLTALTDYEYNEYIRGGFGINEPVPQTITEEPTGNIEVSYYETSAETAADWNKDIPAGSRQAEINLLGVYGSYAMIPGTLRFTWGGNSYGDIDGDLVLDPGGSNSPAGKVNYSDGTATVTTIPSNPEDQVSITRLVVSTTRLLDDRARFRTPGPQRPGSLIVSAVTGAGERLTATADINGDLSGDGIEGTVDAETGVTRVDFPSPVIPGSIRYSTVAYSFIPLDSDLLGLDPIRLPQDGRVPMARPGDVAVIHNTQHTDIGDGDTTTVLRERLSYCHVYDAEGARVPDDDLEIDLDAGTVRVQASTAQPAPFTAEHRIEDMRLIADAQITGILGIASSLSHDFPQGDSYLSTAVLFGDLQGAWTTPFSQSTWTGEWSDERTSDPTPAQYNSVDFPMEVSNEGAIQERWRLRFHTPTTVDVIGEYTGQILTDYPIDQWIEPTNPATGVPYFRIDPDGWGAGWSSGNIVRFNTNGANRPIWIARTVRSGDETEDTDEFRIQLRGDAN